MAKYKRNPSLPTIEPFDPNVGGIRTYHPQEQPIERPPLNPPSYITDIPNPIGDPVSRLRQQNLHPSRQPWMEHNEQMRGGPQAGGVGYQPPSGIQKPLDISTETIQNKFPDMVQTPPTESISIEPKGEIQTSTYQPPNGLAPEMGVESKLPQYQRETQPSQEEFAGDPELDRAIKTAVMDGLTGEDPEIKALTGNHDRDTARLLSDGMNEARAIAAEKGYAPGTEEYNQVMRGARQQINDATQKSQRNLYSAIRTKRQQSLNTAMELKNQLWGEGQDLWERKREKEKNTEAQLQQLINNIPHQGIRNILAIFGKDVDGARNWLKAVIDPNTGQPLDQYRDTPYDVIARRAIDLVRAQNPTMAAKYTDAQGNFDYNTAQKDPSLQGKIGDHFTKLWEAEFAPIESASEAKEEKEAQNTRLQKFINTGDYSDMNPDDWKQLTGKKLSEARKHIIVWDKVKSENKGDDWGDKTKLNTSMAEKKFLERNPIARPENKGKIIEYNGKLYKIVEPLYNDEGNDWLGRTVRQISTLIEPVEGGEPVHINVSSWYDPY